MKSPFSLIQRIEIILLVIILLNQQARSWFDLFFHNDNDIHEKNENSVSKKSSGVRVSNNTIISNTSNVILTSSSPMYYLSTQEGLIAHLRYIQALSAVAKYYDRRILLVPFSSIHYPDVPDVNLCDYFHFPNHISCINDSSVSLLQQMDCVYTGYSQYNSDSGIPRFIKVERTNNFDFKTVDCLAGQILYHSGNFPRGKISVQSLFEQGFFKIIHKYRILLQDAVNILRNKNSANSTVIAVTHWRRGDELETRCKRGKNSTVNCGTAYTLMEHFEKKIQLDLRPSNDKFLVKYVATNERNVEHLNPLWEHGYTSFKSLEISQKFQNLDSVARFLIDLMLMCSADYFISWGYTLVYHYTTYCRRFHKW